jgi:methionyl aminopeptidase
MNQKHNIKIKTPEEIIILSEAGKILASIIKDLSCSLKSGMTTSELNAICDRLIAARGVLPAFKGYRGYPASTCISINEQIVHGIPGPRVIKEADLVSIDVGIIYQGYYSDTAITLAVGKISSREQELLEVTEQALYEGISKAKPGNRLSDISHAIQTYVESNGFSVVRDFVGHGIGKNLHEEPEIPNFGSPHQGAQLVPGMVLAIEPMVNMGTWQTKIIDDGWTVETLDGKPSAHFEHSVAIMENGPLVLTERNG